MSDLRAFARRLAESVAAHDPAALRSPIPVAEIMLRMMPYRACRSTLGLETAEEYELLLLRLVAEEFKLVRTFPPESAERCRVEVAAVLPDLGFLRQLNEVTILLDLATIAAAPVPQVDAPAPEDVVGTVGEVEEIETAESSPRAEESTASSAPVRPAGTVDQPASAEALIDPLEFDPEAEGLDSPPPGLEPVPDPASEPLGHGFDSSEFAIPAGRPAGIANSLLSKP